MKKPLVAGWRHFYDELPSGSKTEFFPVAASDGAETFGILYKPARSQPKTALVVVHPRGDFTRHYLAPELVSRGYALLCHTTRYLNNDSDAVHERILLDVAASIRRLRATGYEQVILVGNSGGGSLLAFYQSQASKSPSDRISESPGGYRVPLADEEMPLGDGIVLLAAHAGEGHFARKIIDPAVTDESDPHATDLELDMYNPANGRRPWPEPSEYDRDWLQRYREAQDARCRRLDNIAKQYAAARRTAVEAGNYGEERSRRLVQYLVVYRTLADPEYLDPTIDPSDRPLGSVFATGVDPFIANYGYGGLARVMTPRGWLSTWSANSSNAFLPANAPDIREPCVIIGATGDSEVRPAEFEQITESCRMDDKTVFSVKASHYFEPLDDTATDPRAEVGEILESWLQPRFPA